jgi:type IV pilus assembly protein PilX
MRSTLQRHAQRGVSMLFALLALGALVLASIALIRSVDSGSLVIGNMGFKQETTAYADRAAEQAITFLSGQVGGTGLDANVTSEGYYATAYTNLDPTNSTPATTTRAVIDWAGDGCSAYTSGTFTGGCLAAKTSVSGDGKATQYVITRFCSSALAATDSTNVCSNPLTSTAAESPVKGSVDYTTGRFAAALSSPYYRIVVRTTGPRNTESYTDTVVHY